MSNSMSGFAGDPKSQPESEFLSKLISGSMGDHIKLPERLPMFWSNPEDDYWYEDEFQEKDDYEYEEN